MEIIEGDCLDALRTLAPASVDCIVSSPPYYRLRHYGHRDEHGREPTLAAYLDRQREVLRALARVLHPTGTCWWNVGDTWSRGTRGASGPIAPGDRQATNRASALGLGRGGGSGTGLPYANLCLIPTRIALAAQEDGWIVRSHIIWHKASAMPDGAPPRPTSAHESILLLARTAPGHYYDGKAVTDPRTGARLRDVWTLGGERREHDHRAAFPSEIPRRCILLGCPPGGLVLDPYLGSGTTGRVAEELGRRAIGIELNPEFAALARKRRPPQPGLAL